MICRLALICLLCACCACSRTPPGCDTLYVILPDNYIVDVAAGSQVVLDPSSQDFAVFCSPKNAQAALEAADPYGDWRVYSLEGEYEDLAQDVGGGQYLLRRPAKVNDWVEVQ